MCKELYEAVEFLKRLSCSSGWSKLWGGSRTCISCKVRVLDELP
jgi:hypothetical protein